MLEIMSGFKMRPISKRFVVESATPNCASGWIQLKIHSSYVDHADETNSVSYSQLYTFCFDEAGKVSHYIIMNDARDMGRFAEAMAPIE